MDITEYKGFIKGFKAKDGNIYGVDASAISGLTPSETNVFEDYAEPYYVDETSAGGKTHKGIRVLNGSYDGLVEVGSTGNLSVEATIKNLNLEAANSIQIKPTNIIKFDSSRRIEAGDGNVVEVKASFDDYKDFNKGVASAVEKYGGKTGNDEEYAELKIKARNIDLRCYGHGGVAIQPCGKDGEGFENKIKFESSRTSAIGEVPTYSTEGGKGLEFGTFNNEHASLYVGDYRFKGDATVYAASRGVPSAISKDKFDYPTQEDDFKDIIPSTGATWDEILTVARKYADGEISGDGQGGDIINLVNRVVALEEAVAALKEKVDAAHPNTASDVSEGN